MNHPVTSAIQVSSGYGLAIVDRECANASPLIIILV
jgi:hypothetical protein